MRCHFVYFDEALLVTSDSPISQWRRHELDDLLRGMGPMSVDEVRFPPAPTLALVMSWEPGEPRMVRGDRDVARELEDVAELLNEDAPPTAGGGVEN